MILMLPFQLRIFWDLYWQEFAYWQAINPKLLILVCLGGPY